MDHAKSHGSHAGQFTSDDCARISASALNAVLEKLNIRQTVEGIAVLPAGEGVFLVDILHA